MTSNLQGGCTIEITDTGVGFDPAAVPEERLGLRISIRERVTSAGGTVKVRTGVGRGTTITLEWPQADGEPDSVARQFSVDEMPVLGRTDDYDADGRTSA